MKIEQPATCPKIIIIIKKTSELFSALLMSLEGNVSSSLIAAEGRKNQKRGLFSVAGKSRAKSNS